MSCARAPPCCWRRNIRTNLCEKGSRQARQGHPRSRPHRYGPTILKERDTYGKRKALTHTLRLPRWRDPGPRRVHGRHHPLHHPQRQGPRYETTPNTANTANNPHGTPEANNRIQFARTTFSAFSSPSARPGGSVKRANACVCDLWD